MAEEVYEIDAGDLTVTPSSRGLLQAGKLAFLYLIFVAIIGISSFPLWDGDNKLMDFGSFYASGLKAQNGENPYDQNSEYIFEIVFPEVGAGGLMMNLNPPISVIVFRFLADLNPYRALFTWQIMSAALYAISIVLLAVSYKQNMTPALIVWAFTLAGFWHTLVLGQVYALLLAFTVIGWVFLQNKKFTLAGIAIGLLIAIKPNFAVWSVFLLVSGYYVTFLVSAITSLLISLLPVILYGTGIYQQWLEASTLYPETLIMPGNTSILGLTTRFEAAISVGIAISVVLVIVLLGLSRRINASIKLEAFERVSALGIIASLLASPLSWTGYTILLLPIFFSLKHWTASAFISAAILSVPFGFVLQLFQTSFANFILFGWLYGWASLFMVGDVVANTMMTRSIQTN